MTSKYSSAARTSLCVARKLSTMASKNLRALEGYNGCDISDALLKLKVPNAGFIPDLLPYAPHGPHSPHLHSQPKIIAPASTVLLVPKSLTASDSTESKIPNQSNIPSDKHYVDMTEPDTVVMMSQPSDQICAVLGGIMALRMKMRGARCAVVGGRIRDLRELRGLEFPVFAKATSAVATGYEAKPWAINVPVDVNGVAVNPGDIVFVDPIDGVVVIPKDKLDDVVQLLPGIAGEDERVVEDVKAGGNVKDAFAKHRS